MLALRDKASKVLKDALGYTKFRTPRSLCIVVVDGGYHLHQEATRALKKIGHRVFCVTPSKTSTSNNLTVILEALVQYRPDFILMINHIGLDADGSMGAVLDDLEIPVASWYCDSPMFVLRDGKIPAPNVSTIFVWEKALIGVLKQLGAQDVHHLPLGCDPEVFRQPENGSKSTYRLAFVGDSMADPLRIWRSRLAKKWHPDAEAIAQMLIDKRQPMAETMLVEQAQSPTKPVWDILALGTFLATQHYRLANIRSATPFELVIFGDKDWRHICPDARHAAPVRYGPDLSKVYAACDISLNATSLQMPTAVNQRVFDVPMAGGFVLSDNQPDLADFFDLGSEAVVYNGPQELASLISYFQHHPRKRSEVTAKARQRIMRNHTYMHRLDKMCRMMAARHRKYSKIRSISSLHPGPSQSPL